MFSTQKMHDILKKNLGKIFVKVDPHHNKYMSYSTIMIQSKDFGKLALCFYKESNGKYYLMDGGTIFKRILPGNHDPHSYLDVINKYLPAHFTTSGQILKYRVNNYSDLVKAVATFFMFIKFLIEPQDN